MTSHFESSCGNEKRKLATNKVRTDGRTLRPENKNLMRWLLKRRKKASFFRVSRKCKKFKKSSSTGLF